MHLYPSPGLMGRVPSHSGPVWAIPTNSSRFQKDFVFTVFTALKEPES